MSARQNILSRLHASTGKNYLESRAVRETVPATAIESGSTVVTSAFINRAAQSGADVQRLTSRAEFDEAFRSLSCGASLMIEDSDLSNHYPTLECAGTDAEIALVWADAGIAETGSLCFRSAQTSSQSLFLHETLVVLLNESDIVRYQEDYWRREERDTPRAVHIVTGPSRTADVEQTIQIGAHGPRSLTVLCLGAVIAASLQPGLASDEPCCI